MVPPAATLTVELTAPLPARVAPLLTTMGPVPVAEPEALFTKRAPARTLVPPV